MRLAVAIALSLVACDEHGSSICEFRGMTYELGDTFPAGDGCNTCSCTASGVGCTGIACFDAGTDGAATSCAPSAGCTEGPMCGTTCCGQGEKCVGGACLCGNNAACGANDSCEAAGPVGGDACGAICCGASGPCPL